jgi:hypothetical protein
VAGQLAEDEGDEEHPDDRDPGEPDVRRATGADAKYEQRVDAHHRRQVRERDREVGEQAEHPIELGPVPQTGEPGIVTNRAGNLGHHVMHRGLLACVGAW